MQDEGAAEAGAPADPGEGMPPEAIDAALTVLMMMAKAGGPNAELFQQAGQALQSEVQGDQGGAAPAAPEQAGTNPNAQPMR